MGGVCGRLTEDEGRRRDRALFDDRPVLVSRDREGGSVGRRHTKEEKEDWGVSEACQGRSRTGRRGVVL